MRPFLIRWLVTTIAVAVAVFLTGMHADSFIALAGTALFLGVINALIRPLLMLLSLPFIIVTFGFFILLINAGILYVAGALVPGFHVGGFWNAFFGAFIVSVVSWFLSLFARGGDGRYYVITRSPGMKRVHGRVVD